MRRGRANRRMGECVCVCVCVNDVRPYRLGEGEFALSDLGKNLFVPIVARAVEGGVPAEKDVHDHTHRPHVRRVRVALREHLGGDVVAGAHRGLHLLHAPPPAPLFEGVLTQPKVDEFDLRGVHEGGEDPKEGHGGEMV